MLKHILTRGLLEAICRLVLTLIPLLYCRYINTVITCIWCSVTVLTCLSLSSVFRASRHCPVLVLVSCSYLSSGILKWHSPHFSISPRAFYLLSVSLSTWQFTSYKWSIDRSQVLPAPEKNPFPSNSTPTTMTPNSFPHPAGSTYPPSSLRIVLWG